MATRVGYRALIVDDERPAYQLAQFLMRPDLNGKVIQSFFISDKLNDAYTQAETCDFIYIDPFTFGMAESIRFVAEVQSRWPVKAFTLVRSNRQWQERQRDIEGLALPPAKLRTMLFLDKDTLADPAFAQAIRNNLASMEREFQQELQRSGFSDPARSGFSDLGVPRVGTWFTAPEYAATGRPANPYESNPGIGNLGGLPYNPMSNAAQLQAIIDAAVAAALRQPMLGQPRTPTTPLLPPASDTAQMAQLQQSVNTVQQQLSGMQQNIATLQGAQGKLQEQSLALQRDQRDFRTAISSADQRVHDLEARVHTSEQENARLRSSQRTLQILLIVALVLGVASLVVGILAVAGG